MSRLKKRNIKGVSRLTNADGYIQIYEPTHPLAFKNGYVLEHRKVWFESGRELPKGYLLHHKNHDRKDNRLENLEVMLWEEHSKMEFKRWRDNKVETRIPKRCKICGTEHFSYLGLCRRCYRTVWARKKRSSKIFKSKRIYSYFEEQGLI